MRDNFAIYIPGRTKSKRLPNKLLLPFYNDETLWSIACAKLADLRRRFSIPVYTLCCEEELMDISKKYDIPILLRDPHTIDIDDPIRETMGAVEQAKEEYMMFLNPCLSMIGLMDLMNAIINFTNSGKKYATSAKPFKNWLFDEKSKPLTDIDTLSLNTKEINGLYQAAHCFHIFHREEFLETGRMLDMDSFTILPIREEATIDVDTRMDFIIAQQIYKNYREQTNG